MTTAVLHKNYFDFLMKGMDLEGTVGSKIEKEQLRDAGRNDGKLN